MQIQNIGEEQNTSGHISFWQECPKIYQTGNYRKQGIPLTIDVRMRSLFSNLGHGSESFLPNSFFYRLEIFFVIHLYLQRVSKMFMELSLKCFAFTFQCIAAHILSSHHLSNPKIPDRSKRHQLIVLGGLSTGSFIFIMIVLLRVKPFTI